MQEPLVSILIPAYNAAMTIHAAIESCMTQTYSNIELLVLDDASTDNTLNEISKFKNVTLIKNETNIGRPEARNTLLKKAKGEYIAWLDADDYMLPVRIERQVEFMMNHPDVDIAGSWILTDNRTISKKKFPIENNLITSFLWFKNCMVQPAIISKNFYSAENVFYDTSFYFMQDYEMWFRLRSKKVFANLPEYLTHYHYTSAIETEQKNARYYEKQATDRLWKIKWAKNDYGLGETEKLILQKFLMDAEKLSQNELKLTVSVLWQLYHHPDFGKLKENKLVLRFFALLVFKNFTWINRLTNIVLLATLFDYRKLKKVYLIQ